MSFAAILVAEADGRWQPVALFECSHGDRSDYHRYDRDGVKGPAQPFHRGTPAEAYRAAVALIVAEHERMIERWRQ